MDQFSALQSKKVRFLLLAIPLAWLLAVSIPEVLRDRIFPFDSALIAANGALFQKMFADFAVFIGAPVDWLWGYYEQYPALSVRRHPPLYGFVAGIVYSITGVSTMSAKLTVMLFGLLFASGVFVVARRLTGNYLLASAVTLLVVATPQIAIHFRSVWLDIPSLAFAIWVFHFYLLRLDGNTSTRNVLGMVVFATLALYTYQPTIVLLSGVFLHWLLLEYRTIYKDSSALIGAAVLVVLMLPLVAFTLLLAPDNLQITTGEIPEVWKEFDSPTYAQWMVTDKLSIAYWIVYMKMILASAPLQFFGVGLWMLLRTYRKPSSRETLMFVCFVVTYIGFSWLIVKGHRYTLYMMIPASFLTVAAVRDLLQRITGEAAKTAWLGGGGMLVLAALQGIFASPYVPYSKLSGMQDPVAFLLDAQPESTVLYSGRNDAAFVFYVRSLDEQRAVHIHRASVQLPDPGGLEDYVAAEDIDYIFVEIENDGYDTLEIIDAFRDTILGYVQETGNFELLAEFQLPYGAYDAEGNALMYVYGRSR